MIMSGCKCSMKMSVYERTDVDYQGAIKDTAVLNGVMEGKVTVAKASGLMGVSERHGWRLLAAYREEGPAAVSSREQREKAGNHHVPEDTTEGDGVGRGALCRTQPYPSDRDAGRALEDVHLSRSTVRRVLLAGGLGSPRRRRPRTPLCAPPYSSNALDRTLARQ